MKTTRFITTALFSFIFLFSIKAQIAVSVQMGTHHSSTQFDGISNEVLPDLNAIKDFTGGIAVDYSLDPRLSVRSGVNFKQKGFITSVMMPLNIGDFDLPLGVKAENRINYIEVPLLLSYKLPSIGAVRPYISAGPSLAYAQSGFIKTKGTAIIDFVIDHSELDLSSDTYRRTELVGNIMGGIEVPYGKGFFSLEAGYEKAMRNFMTDSFIVDTGARHKGISFKVGYGHRF